MRVKEGLLNKAVVPDMIHVFLIFFDSSFCVSLLIVNTIMNPKYPRNILINAVISPVILSWSVRFPGLIVNAIISILVQTSVHLSIFSRLEHDVEHEKCVEQGDRPAENYFQVRALISDALFDNPKKDTNEVDYGYG